SRRCRRLACMAALCALASLPVAAAPSCPPADDAAPGLSAWRQPDFMSQSSDALLAWATGMVGCLSHPNPAWRDGQAYEGLSTLLRKAVLTPAAQAALAESLLQVLQAPDPAYFGPPFAALVLAELVAADARRPALPLPLLQRIGREGAAFLASVQDRRGFDAQQGWRHAVAHGADWVAAIAGHPGLRASGLHAALRDAVAAQLAPSGHRYTEGESERLMVAVVHLARSGCFSAADWKAWFLRQLDPSPMGSWAEAFGSALGLTRRHNLRGFLFAVLVEVRLNQDATDDLLLPAAEAALRAMR
ncbi:MAG: DUF2785 domain-containing protein, partial [Burkholderiales bacterium]|nr:DUF2785 domain-containing protein [Burkholderiales bacterium]